MEAPRSLSYRGDAGEMQARCGRDVGEMQARCRGDAGEVYVSMEAPSSLSSPGELWLSNLIETYLPKRLLLWLRCVFALPSASSSGFDCTIRSGLGLGLGVGLGLGLGLGWQP